MATVLILEPHPEVRELLGRIVRRAGHEEASDDAAIPAGDVAADVVIVEPAGRSALDRAAAVVAATGAPVVCVSIFPPSDAVLALDPAAYIVKPFSLAELEQAIAAAAELGPRASA